MIFQIQKNLFAESVRRVAGVLVQGQNNSAEPGQYIVVKTEGKTLSTCVAAQHIVAKTVIDRYPDIKINENGSYTITGSMLQKHMSSNNVADIMTAEFKPAEVDATPAESEAAEDGEEPVSRVVQKGGFVLLLPSKTKTKERYKIPVVSLDINPTIDTTGENRFVVSAGELAKYVKRIGLAYSKDSGNPIFRNCLIRIAGNELEVAVINEQQLAWAKNIPCRNSGKDFSMTVPYEELSSIAGMLVADQDVEVIFNNKSNPATAVFVQDVIYGDKTVGQTLIKVTCAREAFQSFEKTVGKLSFVAEFSANAAGLREHANKLENLKDTPRTSVSFKNGIMTFSKNEADGEISDLEMEFSTVNGAPFDFAMSSRILKQIADGSEEEDIRFSLSGKTSLVKCELGSNLTTYFLPFKA